jgi:hypothetical protein
LMYVYIPSSNTREQRVMMLLETALRKFGPKLQNKVEPLFRGGTVMSSNTGVDSGPSGVAGAVVCVEEVRRMSGELADILGTKKKVRNEFMLVVLHESCFYYGCISRFSYY